MPDHPNVQAIRTGYTAFNGGALDALAGILAADVVWHVPGRSSIAGDYQGREATFAYFAQLQELTGATYQADLHIAVGDDDHVITVDHTSATQGDRSYGETQLMVFRFANRRIVEAWQAPLNLYRHDDFFG